MNSGTNITFPLKRRKLIIALTCVLIGLLVRWMYCISYPVPIRDSYEYINQIEQWIATKEIPENGKYPKLSIVLLGSAAKLGYDIYSSGIVINLILGLGIILLLIDIAERITKSTTPGLVAGLLAACNKSLCYYSCHLLRENSYLFFLCLAIDCFIIFLRNDRYSYLILCALAASTCFLCRYEGIELIPIILISLFFLTKKKRKAVKNIFVFLSTLTISTLCILYFIGTDIKSFVGDINSKYTNISQEQDDI